MPNIKSAKKELRKSIKRQAHNKDVKDELKSLIKKSRKSIVAKEETAKDAIKLTIKKLDKAAQKGIIKKNTASRKKSRLVKQYNKSTK